MAPLTKQDATETLLAPSAPTHLHGDLVQASFQGRGSPPLKVRFDVAGGRASVLCRGLRRAGGPMAAARWGDGKRNSEDFVVGVRLEPFGASVSIPELGRAQGGDPHSEWRFYSSKLTPRCRIGDSYTPRSIGFWRRGLVHMRWIPSAVSMAKLKSPLMANKSPR